MSSEGVPLSKSGSRRHGRRWGTADTVVAASAGLVAVVLIIFVVLCIQGYSTTLDGAKARAMRAAEAVAEGSHWTIGATMASLEVAATEIVGGGSSADAIGAFNRTAVSLPVVAQLRYYAPDGRLLWQSPGPPATEDISDSDAFMVIAGDAAAAFGYGRNDPANFTVSKRVESSGNVLGLLVAELPGSMLSRFAVPHQLGEGATVSVVRGDGWVIAREPPLPKALNLKETAAWPLLSDGEQGSYVSEVSPVDGMSRIVGFQRVTGLNYIAVASISKAVVFGGLWYSIWVVSLLLAPFAVVLLAGSVLTARILRRAEASSVSLAEALEQNKQLFREIHHRVKNNLQSVSALLQVHPISSEVRADLNGRLFAMSAVHEHIYRTEQFSDVPIKGYLHTLIDNVRASADPRIEVVDDLADVTVDKDIAGPLGLIVNEVLSNSFKHAFPAGRAGRVAVTLAAIDDNRVQMVVEDDGVGFDQSAPGKGIGRKLIAGFVRQINGEFQFTSGNGSRFVLIFPRS